ncbi:MAG: dihydrodipicolinate synthase family protein [Oscillospiraceae bacterium]|nr:dihydrodipicolinate synthase family protein [Oscillospiraceae bacterium]
MKKLYGLTTAMLTPFTEDGGVDYESFREMTDFYVDRGVHCLYPMGTNGEMFRMNAEERMRAAETVKKQSAGRCTVYIHCGAVSEEETISLVRHAESIGADGAGVVTPTFFGLTEEEKLTYYTHVSQSVPFSFPIYLYSIPSLANNDLPLSTVEKIAKQCPNVTGIKYSGPDMMLLMDYLTVRNSSFSVLPGFEKLMLPALACGADGAISGVSSAFPEPFVALYQAFKAGELAEAQRLSMICSIYIRAMRFGCSHAFLKAVLRERGLKSGYVRKPGMELSPSEADSLRDLLKTLPSWK